MSLRSRELVANLDAIYQAIEYGRDEAAAKTRTLSVFADWTRGTYGLESDTDIFIICPRTTDGTVVLEDNGSRLMDFFVELGQSQGVMVFKASLEYARKGLPIYLEAFAPSRVTVQPLDGGAVHVFDKDTMYKQHCLLKDVQDRDGQHICTVSTTNSEVVLPRNAFTSRPPDKTFFNQKFSGDLYRRTVTEVYAQHAVVLIPKERIRRALQFEKDITDAISNFKRMGSSAPGDPEWELPFCLKGFAVEADCGHLLEILDISVTQEKFNVWKEVIEILCQFGTVNDIGTARIFASVKKFSFKKVQPFLGILYTQLTTTDDVTSFTVGIQQSSSVQDQDELRQWCTIQENTRIVTILGSDEKTLSSLVQYGFIKGLPLLSDFIKTLSQDKGVNFTFWLSLVSHLDRQWQSINSSSFTGAPLRELHFMLDQCISAMTPLMSEGVVYAPVAQDLMDNIRRNAEAHVRRILIVIEICLRFSSVRCGDVLSEVLVTPGDVHIKFDLFYRPLARSLRSLLEQYESTIFRPPFFVFYRFLVGMYLSFYLGGEFMRRGRPPLATMLCTKKVVCDRCESIEEFLSSGGESRELVVMNKEWAHLRHVMPKLKDRIFPPAVTEGELWKEVRITKRPKQHIEAAKEFLRLIGDEGEVSRLMEPLDEDVRKALNDEEVFDFERCLQFSPSLPGGSQTS